MPNLLTAEAGLKLGPIFLETFFKHYLDRHHADYDIPNTETGTSSADKSKRKKDLLWQEGFQIVKVRVSSIEVSHGEVLKRF